MLVVYFGTDRKQCRSAADAYIKKQGDGVTINTIDDRSYTEGSLENAVGAESLFGNKELYVLDTPSRTAEFEAAVKDKLEEIAESSNTFIVIEGALLAPAKKRYAKHAEIFEEFSADKAERFNTFALADALAKRDRRTLWLLLQEARSLGFSDEELIGILWWQLKALRLANITTNATEAGMKDYPYQKAKRSLQAFAAGDIDRLSHTLLKLYHEGHAGIRELDTALEKWILTV